MTDKRHMSAGVQTVHIDENSELENTMTDKTQACDDCGLLFDSTPDVQRHLKRGWCPENSDPPAKRIKTANFTEPDSDHEDNTEDNEGFLLLWKRVKSDCKEKFDKLHQQYIDDGEDEDDATEMAEYRIKSFKERKFLQKKQFIS